jgi:hypothetical protein
MKGVGWWGGGVDCEIIGGAGVVLIVGARPRGPAGQT